MATVLRCRDISDSTVTYRLDWSYPIMVSYQPLGKSDVEDIDDMSQDLVPLPTSHQWEAERLRITNFFPVGVDTSDSGSWWEKIVGREPDEIVSRSGMGSVQQTGDVGGRNLTLLLRPGRVDLQLLPPPISEELLEKGIPTVGPISDVLETFVGFGEKWLEICPPTNRLAFGGILLLPVASRNLGYQKLGRYLPNVQIPENSSDFSYQINQPRKTKSGVSSLTINRLNKWSVIIAGSFRFTVTGITPTMLEEGPQEFAVRLELDINTSAEYRGELPNDKLLSVFQELVRFGREITESGDTP